MELLVDGFEWNPEPIAQRLYLLNFEQVAHWQVISYLLSEEAVGQSHSENWLNPDKKRYRGRSKSGYDFGFLTTEKPWVGLGLLETRN